jgi:hypothetical protein
VRLSWAVRRLGPAVRFLSGALGMRVLRHDRFDQLGHPPRAAASSLDGAGGAEAEEDGGEAGGAAAVQPNKELQHVSLQRAWA